MKVTTTKPGVARNIMRAWSQIHDLKAMYQQSAYPSLHRELTDIELLLDAEIFEENEVEIEPSDG